MLFNNDVCAKHNPKHLILSILKRDLSSRRQQYYIAVDNVSGLNFNNWSNYKKQWPKCLKHCCTEISFPQHINKLSVQFSSTNRIQSTVRDTWGCNLSSMLRTPWNLPCRRWKTDVHCGCNKCLVTNSSSPASVPAPHPDASCCRHQGHRRLLDLELLRHQRTNNGIWQRAHHQLHPHVTMRLDYANSIMYGMSASNMHKLKSAQNSLTCVVLPSLRHLSVQQVSNSVTSTGFLLTTKYSS